MNCETFITMLDERGERSGEFLAHLRTCDSCINVAIESDPDLLFRGIGGSELVPPGGLDEFAGEVLQQISLRQAERLLSPRRTLTAPFRWGIAAALAIVVGSAALWNRSSVGPEPRATASVVAAHTLTTPSVVRPVVDNYASSSATIIEVPSGNDIQLVMIFDEKLPADL